MEELEAINERFNVLSIQLTYRKKRSPQEIIWERVSSDSLFACLLWTFSNLGASGKSREKKTLNYYVLTILLQQLSTFASVC